MDVIDSLIKPTQTFITRSLQRASEAQKLFPEILDQLNVSLEIIAGSTNPLILLPALKTTWSVATSTTLAYAIIPTTTATFYRRLYKVDSANNPESDGYKRINVIQSEERFREYWGDMGYTGDVIEDVWADEENGRLYYQPIPTVADTLTLYGYKTPTTIAYGITTLDDIDPSYLRQTLCAHAAASVLINNGHIDQGAAIMQVFSGGMQALYNKISGTYDTIPIKRTTLGYI